MFPLSCNKWYHRFKDTHKEKTSSNETPALTESMKMDIWVVRTLNQLFIRGSQTETKFSKKNKLVTGKTLFVVIAPFCTHHSICLNVGF